jgi:hypothetical protein
MVGSSSEATNRGHGSSLTAQSLFRSAQELTRNPVYRDLFRDAISTGAAVKNLAAPWWTIFHDECRCLSPADDQTFFGGESSSSETM